MKILSLFVVITTLIFAEAKWDLAVDKNGIKIYTRKLEGHGFKEFKALTTIKTTKAKMKAEFMDISSMSQWYYAVEKVELLKKNSETEAIYKIYFDFPVITDRYSTIIANISSDKTTGDITVTTNYYAIKHKPEPSRVMVTNMASSWNITGKDNALAVEHRAHLDPSGSVPMWIFNTGVTDGPYETLVNLKKRLE